MWKQRGGSLCSGQGWYRAEPCGRVYRKLYPLLVWADHFAEQYCSFLLWWKSNLKHNHLFVKVIMNVKYTKTYWIHHLYEVGCQVYAISKCSGRDAPLGRLSSVYTDCIEECFLMAVMERKPLLWQRNIGKFPYWDYKNGAQEHLAVCLPDSWIYIDITKSWKKIVKASELIYVNLFIYFF